ncbi:MAG TPA: GlsB/YeaQ/YmgE family stress response membrane protein [Thermoanaerobaculia bacterium]|nr:GlsB/YeaQ/YmgE family stress response membrane protein [Thermoanaerobaculia bacterium]
MLKGVELTWIDLLLYLLIAALAGGIGRAIAGGTRGGCLVSLVLGFIGALLGSWIARKVHLPELFEFRFGNGPAFPFLWSVIGAALFVAVVVLVSGGRRD